MEIGVHSVEAKTAQSPLLRGFCCQMAVIHGFFHSLCATQLENLHRGYPLRRWSPTAIAKAPLRPARYTCTMLPPEQRTKSGTSIEDVIYAGDSPIPLNLRGIHQWLAQLAPPLATEFDEYRRHHYLI